VTNIFAGVPAPYDTISFISNDKNVFNVVTIWVKSAMYTKVAIH